MACHPDPLFTREQLAELDQRYMPRAGAHDCCPKCSGLRRLEVSLHGGQSFVPRFGRADKSRITGLANNLALTLLATVFGFPAIVTTS